MNPAPPVTRTRFDFTLELLIDRVEGPAFDPALDAPQILPDERQEEALDAEDEDDAGSGEERPREVALRDPVDDAVDAERGRRERADDPEADADPLDRLRPEPGEH